MNRATKLRLAGIACAFAAALSAADSTRAQTPAGMRAPDFILAQAMVPPTGMMDAQHPMPMNERMLKRFPQPVRVGDLVGLPVLDQNASTLGLVREVVRRPDGDVELIVSYSPWWGWFAHLVAVPIEAVGIEGRQIVSLDMPPEAYAKAPSWHHTDESILAGDATIRVALARN